MHPEVVDGKGGACPICKMALVPVRLDLVWSCPIHIELTRVEPGRCPSCGRDLARVIKALSFTCRVHAKVDQVNPGPCPICKRPLIARYSIRPHGDHNPKHGGQFVMAPNNWHIEVTHPAASVFRLYVYDEYSKPFIPRGFTGWVAPSSHGAKASAVRFARSGTRGYLEARIPQVALPAAIVVRARFQANEPEYRFDFPFFEYSREPATRAPGTK